MSKHRGKNISAKAHIYCLYRRPKYVQVNPLAVMMERIEWFLDILVAVEIPLASSEYRKLFGKLYREATGHNMHSSVTRAVIYMSWTSSYNNIHVPRRVVKFSMRRYQKILDDVIDYYLTGRMRYVMIPKLVLQKTKEFSIDVETWKKQYHLDDKMMFTQAKYETLTAVGFPELTEEFTRTIIRRALRKDDE